MISRRDVRPVRRMRRCQLALTGRLIGWVFVGVVVGCSPPVASVTGTVTFLGKPLPAGRVTFVCEGGRKPILSGTISAAGEYAVADLPVGASRVVVETFAPLPRPTPGTIDAISGVDQSLMWEDTGPYVPIPDHYANPKTSGLTLSLSAGPQQFDIVLSK